MRLFLSFYNNTRSFLTSLGMLGDLIAILIAIICMPFIILIGFFRKTISFLLLFIYEILHYSKTSYLSFQTAAVKWTYIRKLFWYFNEQLLVKFVFTKKDYIDNPPQNPQTSFWTEFAKAILFLFCNAIILFVFLTLILAYIFGLLVTLQAILRLFNPLFKFAFFSSIKTTGTWIFVIESRIYIVISIVLITITRYIRIKKKFPTITVKSIFSTKSVFWTDKEDAIEITEHMETYKIIQNNSNINDAINMIQKLGWYIKLESNYGFTQLQILSCVRKNSTLTGLKNAFLKLSSNKNRNFDWFNEPETLIQIKNAYNLLGENLKTGLFVSERSNRNPYRWTLVVLSLIIVTIAIYLFKSIFH